MGIEKHDGVSAAIDRQRALGLSSWLLLQIMLSNIIGGQWRASHPTKSLTNLELELADLHLVWTQQIC